MSYIGDIALSKTFDTKFTTVGTTGLPTTLAGSPVISAYADNSLTQITAGITLSVDFDGVTGLHNIRVVATGANGYAAGSNYQLVITTGTVGGTSVVGYVVAEFSIEARSALRPTTADRTLDIATTGEAGLDFDNIKDASGAHTLTNIRVPNVTLADTVTTYTGNTPQTGDVFPLASSEIADIKAKTDNLPALPAATGDIPTANQNADALLDRANAIETGLTLRGALRLIAAACAGIASGLATATAIYRNAVANSKPRITATVDADGNRTAIVTDVT